MHQRRHEAMGCPSLEREWGNAGHPPVKQTD